MNRSIKLNKIKNVLRKFQKSLAKIKKMCIINSAKRKRLTSRVFPLTCKQKGSQKTIRTFRLKILMSVTSSFHSVFKVFAKYENMESWLSGRKRRS